MNEDISLKHFSGVLPIFPLTNVVLFPHVVLPLHIFEKRYQKLLDDSMSGEKLIGMAVLKPGWETHYEGNPDIYPSACVGKIIDHEPLAHGRSNIMLLGLKRIHIKEIVTPRPYRTAKVELLHDVKTWKSGQEKSAIRQTLFELYGEIVIEFARSKRKYPALSHLDMTFEQMIDILSASAGLRLKDQIYMLQEKKMDLRIEFLMEKMQERLKKSSPPFQFPSKLMDFLRINLN